MPRRPPGDGGPGAHQRKYLLAFAVLFLTCISLVDAQHGHRSSAAIEIQRQPNDDGRLRDDDARNHDRIRPAAAPGEKWVEITDDVPEGTAPRRKRTAAASSSHDAAAADGAKPRPPLGHANLHLKNLNHQQKQNNPKFNNNDARALATLAPAQSVRAPPSTHRLASLQSRGSGISSPPRARSLEEWEVEDFILLATVDGDLYASDRKTGVLLWHLEVDQPMVETEHHRLNTSNLDDDHLAVDHFIWAVEPSRDGSLYIWMPADPVLARTGLTMKKLVEELSPLANDDPPVIYTGNKKTTMITLDAATGRVLKWFGASGSHVNEDGSCLRPNALYDPDNEECSSTGTITLGRTEYEVAITRKDGRDIAKLKFSEWTPNILDRDLASVYSQTLDNHYHSSRHDGRVYAFDEDEKPMFTHKYSAPVARVFDVCRPWGATRDQNPDLLILPQPVPAPKDDHAALVRSSNIFLNQTEGGSWYALSGLSYPLIVDAPAALTSQSELWEYDSTWQLLSPSQKEAAMVGRHNIDIVRERGYTPPTLPGGPLAQSPAEGENEATQPSTQLEESMIPPIDGKALVDNLMSVPQSFLQNTVALLSNPVLILAAIGFLVFYRKDLIRWCRGKSRQLGKRFQLVVDDQRSEAGDAPADQTPEHSVHDSIPAPPSVDEVDPEAKVDLTNGSVSAERTVRIFTPDEIDAPQDAAPRQEERDEKKELSSDTPDETTTGAEADNGASTEKKKTKAHRGRRGGVKHKKGAKKRETSVSRDDDPPATTVDDAVKNAQKLGNSPKLEPDVVTVTDDMQSVTGPVIKLGNIEVDTEDQLGTGSNGTLVFAGKFDGREVAVKRMLIQFYDIASQETRLLRESDDHPNGNSCLVLSLPFPY